MMIRRVFYLLLIVSLFLGACKSSPAGGSENEPEAAVVEAEADEGPADGEGGTDGESEPDQVYSTPTPLLQDEADVSAGIGSMAEPVLHLAEADLAALPSESSEDGGNDAAPTLPEPSPASGDLDGASGVPEPSHPVPVIAAQPLENKETVSPPPVLPAVPSPPHNLKPAEEVPPAIVWEPSSTGTELLALPVPAASELSPITPIPAVSDEDVVFSRVVRATVGQLIEIPFRGTGWVYLGELGARRGIVYDSRRLDSEGQSFVFRAEAAGTYALKFYKQDYIRDFILNDHVQVLIGEPPAAAGAGWFSPPVDRGRVVAEPRWPETGGSLTGDPSTKSSLPQRPAVSALPQTVPEDSSVPNEGIKKVTDTPPDEDISGILQKAREEFEAGRVAAAILALEQFRERFPSGSDEAWWLLGQFYEANSPSRDIRVSLDYYRALIREYPQSNRYDDARRRIAYLERFYINIQ
jgi:hypothetical protein